MNSKISTKVSDYLQNVYGDVKKSALGNYVLEGGLFTYLAGTKKEIEESAKKTSHTDWGLFDFFTLVGTNAYIPLFLAHEYFPDTHPIISAPIFVAAALEVPLRVIRGTKGKNSRLVPGYIGTLRECADKGITELKKYIK